MPGRSRRAVIAALAAWLMLLSPAADASEQQPPDQVDPPAPGEGEPLDDPSDPAPPAYTTNAQPSPSVNLTGTTWRQPAVRRLAASSRYRAAVIASRRGWRDGSSDVVVAGGKSFYSSMAAASLAGTRNAPLLLTPPDRVPGFLADEIRRLDARTVFLVGGPSGHVANRLESLGTRVVRLRGPSEYATAMAVARKVVKASGSRTVVIASGRSWRPSLGVPAFAANKRFPVLLARKSSGRAELTQRVRELGARRTIVVGSTRVISNDVVSRLPNRTRIDGSSTTTVTRLARRGRNTGMRGRPTIVSGRHWVDAVVWGTKAGDRDDGVLLASTGRGLSSQVAGYLHDYDPRAVTIAQSEARLPQVARCQVAQGRFRSWFCAEQTLRAQGYVVPRRADGRTDRFSVFAIYAFEKVAGLRPNGHFGNTEWRLMLRNPRVRVRRPDLPKKHVEINIGKQLILLIEKGRVRNHIHTSTGKPSTPTVRGTFTVYEKRPYRQSNGMYYSIFFYGGYAIHGYPSIPLYPASHGCARTYDGNQDFIYPRVFIGERVATY